MEIQCLDSLDHIDAQAWNRLVQDNNPFLRHEFLASLEHHECVGEKFGWLPRHIVVYENQQLIAAMPLYEKYNSYGEFVFDHGWANAYQQQNLDYYPKLVSTIPYSPVSGQRFLVPPGRENELYPILLSAALQVATQLEASSFHCLFPWAEQQDWMEKQGLLSRHDCQFHWYNQNYQSFDDFLQTLNAKKRKNIKQERRKVHDAGLTLHLLNGHSATLQDWQQFAFFYNHTFESKWGTPTLNQSFFSEMAQGLGEQVLLVMVDNPQGECIAGSLMFSSNTRLYGRHWGCTEEHDCLHFEACYYQGIEYCIQHGLQVFEPGAQGEHKVPRGFIPTLTRSSHWLRENHFYSAIKRHTTYEQRALADYVQSVQEHIPYRPDTIPPIRYA